MKRAASQRQGQDDRAGSHAGGVAAILAALLRDGGAPEGLGPAVCVAFGCAAVFSKELAEAVTPFTTSVIYGYANSCGVSQRCIAPTCPSQDGLVSLFSLLAVTFKLY